MPMPRKRDKVTKFLPAAVGAMLAAALWAGCARADESAPGEDSLLKSLMKAGGFATDVNPPKDFVLKARPPAGDDYVPIFRPAFVRKSKAKTPAELKALETDFSSVQARHDSMRAAFPPAAKAVAEQKAAEAAKAKKKKAPLPDAPAAQ
jgi:hypothetical protein